MSNHRKASTEELEKLHAALAEALADRIKDKGCTAADMAVARQFLKDNGIDSIATSSNPVGELAKVVPFPSNDQEEESEQL